MGAKKSFIEADGDASGNQIEESVEEIRAKVSPSKTGGEQGRSKNN